jgi:hypothetical protein
MHARLVCIYTAKSACSPSMRTCSNGGSMRTHIHNLTLWCTLRLQRYLSFFLRRRCVGDASTCRTMRPKRITDLAARTLTPMVPLKYALAHACINARTSAEASLLPPVWRLHVVHSPKLIYVTTRACSRSVCPTLDVLCAQVRDVLATGMCLHACAATEIPSAGKAFRMSLQWLGPVRMHVWQARCGDPFLPRGLASGVSPAMPNR